MDLYTGHILKLVASHYTLFELRHTDTGVIGRAEKERVLSDVATTAYQPF